MANTEAINDNPQDLVVAQAPSPEYALSLNNPRLSEFLHEIFDKFHNVCDCSLKLSKSINSPFIVNEDRINKIHNLAMDLIKKIPEKTGGVSTKFGIRYQDRECQQYEDFDLFMRDAGTKKEPETIELVWSTSIATNGIYRKPCITCTFQTEKTLDGPVENPFNMLPSAIMEVSVSGEDSAWVNGAYEGILPYLVKAKRGWIINLLGFFRGGDARLLFSVACAISARASIEQYALSFFRRDLAERELVLKAENAAELIVNYINYMMVPSSSVSGFIYAAWAGTAGFILIMVICFKLGQYLVPRSYLIIGLTGENILWWRNVKKYLWGSVFFLGIIIPFFHKWIGAAIRNLWEG